MLVAMFSARGKRIGDMAAGTVVLQERVPPRPLWTPVMPPPLAAWAPTGSTWPGSTTRWRCRCGSSWTGPPS